MIIGGEYMGRLMKEWIRTNSSHDGELARSSGFGKQVAALALAVLSNDPKAKASPTWCFEA